MARMRKDKGEKPKVNLHLPSSPISRLMHPYLPRHQVTSLPERPSTKHKYGKKSNNTPKSKSSDSNEALKQNVLALGGTLEDLDLVKGSGSGDGGEFKDDGKNDVSLSSFEQHGDLI